jgi:hypothetical protein
MSWNASKKSQRKIAKENSDEWQALSRSAASDPRQRRGRKNRDAVGSEWLFSSEAAIGRKSLELKL